MHCGHPPHIAQKNPAACVLLCVMPTGIEVGIYWLAILRGLRRRIHLATCIRITHIICESDVRQYHRSHRHGDDYLRVEHQHTHKHLHFAYNLTNIHNPGR